ncbi:MAG TPA: TIGR02147 family protein [Polyangiales bacterium]|nr:TIGR02147 family protein [Polyangiales bacterium]
MAGKPTAGPDRIDVFEYVDYRAYLRDHYAHEKRTRRAFSHRAFSRKVGLGSPNHLKRVMDGERNLTLEMAARFADALALSGEAADYFVQLVRFGQARSSVERARAYERLSTFKAYRRTRKLDLAHAAYHSTWYIPAVRELAGREDFRADAKWIASRLLPPIKSAEAKAALDTLLEIGLLTRDESGAVKQAEPLITTGPEMHALHIASYHRMMMAKAAESIDAVPSDRRDISAVVLLLGDGGMGRIKQRIARFRRELLELALAERRPTQVVQMNFQIFPLSVALDEEDKT